MEFLEDQQNTESSEWTVDTKACKNNYFNYKFQEKKSDLLIEIINE